VRDLCAISPITRQLTRRASSWADAFWALNENEFLHPGEMRDGLAMAPPWVLVCTSSGHSDGQKALEFRGDTPHRDVF